MKYTTSPRKTPSLVAFLLAILFVMAACSEPNKDDGQTKQALPKIAWTHIDGTKQYADAPADGILVSGILTSKKEDIKSVDAIPSSVTSIGDSAFKYCTGLTNITIPNTVTRIGDAAFEVCKALTSITIPASVKSIGAYTFSFCLSLTSITIPNSVTRIGNYAFRDCSTFTSITIPSGVTEIGLGAFYYCTKLESITIPGSLKNIGGSAFGFCTRLTKVSVEATTPPTAGKSIFYETHDDISITVPAGSVAAYKAAEGWKDYADKITGY